MPILADGGLLWVIIIVGSIIAQIIKARKNAATPPPKSPQRQSGSADGDFTASSNELRNFLESIGAAPPAPKPVVQKPRAPHPVQVRREGIPPPPRHQLTHGSNIGRQHSKSNSSKNVKERQSTVNNHVLNQRKCNRLSK